MFSRLFSKVYVRVNSNSGFSSMCQVRCVSELLIVYRFNFRFVVLIIKIILQGFLRLDTVGPLYCEHLGDW